MMGLIKYLKNLNEKAKVDVKEDDKGIVRILKDTHNSTSIENKVAIPAAVAGGVAAGALFLPLAIVGAPVAYYLAKKAYKKAEEKDV